MKRILVLFVFLLHLVFLFANSVDEETVQTVAINFMSDKMDVVGVKNIVTEEYEGQAAFYVVNFQSGGWVMISADNSAVPVLGYGLKGEYKLNDEKPDALLGLTTSYKKQIDHARKLKSSNLEIDAKWDKLLNGNMLKSASLYSAGSQLLNTSRGHVQWGQSKNNDGDCYPSYNQFCPEDDDCVTACNDRTLVGCGAVAMGQIMWYWQWPSSSSYRTYNWGLMLSELEHTTYFNDEDEEVAHLLSDCGLESSMDYKCYNVFWDTMPLEYSWTTTNNIEDAFNDGFKYEGVKKLVKTDWSDATWADLIRSEIDNGRPVFYRGDKCDLCTEKHYFVIDGYDSSDPDFFWFNFGAPNSTSYNISSYSLSSITPSNFDFTENQMAIVGISPTYTEIAPDDVNIYDVSYSSVTGFNSEDAQQNIALPASGDELSVENGGELTLTAGNTITLMSGFHAKAGSNFTAQINTEYTNEMDIVVSEWVAGFSPNGDGINDELCYSVDNANSWEFSAFTSSGIVYQSAGSITGSTVCVWDGTGAEASGTYYCYIRFKNNNGRDNEKTYAVYVSVGSKSVILDVDSISNTTGGFEKLSTGISDEVFGEKFLVYPNPGKGIFNFEFANDYNRTIKIYNSNGAVCFQALNIETCSYTVDLGSFSNGIYLVTCETDNKVLLQKIILEK